TASLEGVFLSDGDWKVNESNYETLINDSLQLGYDDLISTEYWDKAYHLITLTQSKVESEKGVGLRWYGTLHRIAGALGVEVTSDGVIAIVDLDRAWRIVEHSHRKTTL